MVAAVSFVKIVMGDGFDCLYRKHQFLRLVLFFFGKFFFIWIFFLASIYCHAIYKLGVNLVEKLQVVLGEKSEVDKTFFW